MAENKKDTKLSETEKREMLLKFAKKFDSVVADSIMSKYKNNFSVLFNRENVQNYLENPEKYENELVQLSIVLTTISPQYQKIMFYFPAISKFAPVLYPNINKYGKDGKIDTAKMKKDYLKVAGHLDVLNIKHEFKKIIAVCAREDVFYGYEYEEKESYYIKQLNSQYCKISSIEDGCFNFAFDFSFFDKNKKINTDLLEEDLVNYYPSEFQEKYNAYKKDPALRWQELDSSKTICMKFLEDVPYVFPPYANLFNDLSDLVDYKALKKTSSEISNYKLIGLKIPLLDGEEPDNFAVDVNTALTFYNKMLEGLPEGVGAFVTPLDFDDINFESSNTSEFNNVTDAEDNLFTSAGLSSIIFGKGAENSGTLKYSTVYDEAVLFRFYRQAERWLNRKFKRLYNNRFSIRLLDITYYNDTEFKEDLLKQAQYGLPVKLLLSSACDISPLEERGMSILENEVLNLTDEWTPLMSSHTQTDSGSDDGGRPAERDENVGEAGQVTRDNDSNNKR